MEKLNSVSTPKTVLEIKGGDTPLAENGNEELFSETKNVNENTELLTESEEDDESVSKNVKETENEEVNESEIENLNESESENLNESASEIIFDVSEVINGFEEARLVIKKLYNEVFLKTQNFKPTYNDTVADLLAYIGVIAEFNNKQDYYEKAFSISPTKFANKYRAKNYIPYAVKLCVWVDKNKGYNETPKLIDGILRSLFTLLEEESESKTVITIQNSINSIIDYLKNEGIDIGF